MQRIGRYELLSELGRGGFGQVYAALDPTVGRRVAVKILSSHADPRMLSRFRNEAAASGRLRHPNIVTIHDFGEQDGVPYIVMELLEGRDLEQAIAARVPLTILDKIQIMSDAASGLAHAHSQGVIHRDVKPANIMLLHDRSVKVMDFGIALVSQKQATNGRVTPREAMIGSIRYMAPEQFRGREPDERSDIFSYGLLFYELLTAGRHPFEAPDAAAMMYNILNAEPPPVQNLCAELPEELHAVLARLLAKDPDSRYQSLEDVSFDLDPALESLRRVRAAILVSEATHARTRGDLQAAQAIVRAALELVPAHKPARELRNEIQRDLRTCKSAPPPIVETVKQPRGHERSGHRRQAIEVAEIPLPEVAATSPVPSKPKPWGLAVAGVPLLAAGIWMSTHTAETPEPPPPAPKPQPVEAHRPAPVPVAPQPVPPPSKPVPAKIVEAPKPTPPVTIAATLPPPPPAIEARLPPPSLPQTTTAPPLAPPPPQQPQLPSPDIAAIQTTVASFATALSAKNIDAVLAAWPNLPTAKDLRRAFTDKDYSVRYTLQPVSLPVIQGDHAHLAATRTVETAMGSRQNRQSPTTVTVSLVRSGNRWVIADMK